MVAHVATVSLQGIHTTDVDVQVQLSPGLASFQIVGLPDSAVREARERVRGAFHALGIALPGKRITVNLSPADTPKEGSHFDLPIAVGLLMCLGILESDAAENALFMGELGLDGSLSGISGALPAAIHAASNNFESVFLPRVNATEAAWADGINVFGAGHLKDIIAHLKGEETLIATTAELSASLSNEQESLKHASLDFSDIRGQESAKRAAMIAAAGGHNMLMCGPPGSGKSMIAHRITGILPRLAAKEALEVSMVHSVAGMIGDVGLVTTRPFRDPHHSASAVALCGGGLKAKPGEMSLAHRGVLFLDELPEFPRQVLETLRQPLETGNITVSRANHHITYPARFQFIAAMNPCPCGYSGSRNTQCRCAPKQVQSYKGRLSGPLLDRVDLHINVPSVDFNDLSLPPAKEGTAQMREKVQRAREIQEKRFEGSVVRTNAELSGKMLDEFCPLSNECTTLLKNAAEKFSLSARSYHRILRVARTIADLEGATNLSPAHVAEALSYRYIP